jgi:5-methylthioadenosine/S-adenosylhomocysteine deaminase
MIDTRQPHLTPLYHPASHLVYAARGGDVSASIINGQVVMENRELRTLDRERVMEDVNRLARAICTELPDAVAR